MDEAPSPTTVRVDVRSNRVALTWPDGSNSTYAGSHLRYLCPCASCRGHAPGQVEPPSEDQCRDVRITGAEGVGGYAIRFDFSDGHTTGIFTWRLLWAERGSAEAE